MLGAVGCDQMAVSSVMNPQYPNCDSGPYSRHGTHRQLLGCLASFDCHGDMSGIPLVEAAIEEYWAATPAKARKSGLVYIQQILHDQRALGPHSRDFAVTVDAYIEKKLTE
jgi:hypothetical protein